MLAIPEKEYRGVKHRGNLDSPVSYLRVREDNGKDETKESTIIYRNGMTIGTIHAGYFCAGKNNNGTMKISKSNLFPNSGEKPY